MMNISGQTYLFSFSFSFSFLIDTKLSFFFGESKLSLLFEHELVLSYLYHFVKR